MENEAARHNGLNNAHTHPRHDMASIRNDKNWPLHGNLNHFMSMLAHGGGGAMPSGLSKKKLKMLRKALNLATGSPTAGRDRQRQSKRTGANVGLQSKGRKKQKPKRRKQKQQQNPPQHHSRPSSDQFGEVDTHRKDVGDAPAPADG